MMIISILVFFLVAAAAATLPLSKSQSSIGSKIGFQVHSYNDIRSWHQIFLKGATHIKIDPNYQTASFCKTQVRDHERNQKGCFILNHDTPSIFSRRLDYNTTTDLLALLQDKFNPLRPFLTRPNVRVFFALCFKNIPENVCKKGDVAENWIGLVDQLVASYLTVMSRDPDLNVEFVLDSGVPQYCFAQRWRPLVSTSGDFPNAFLSNDKDMGYDRWQVLNGKWPPGNGGQFDKFAKAHWGKFVNSTYAFQVYEPSNQRAFLAASDVYISQGYNHPEGLKFAINVDVAMSEVYLSSKTGRGFNEFIPNASSSKLVSISNGALMYTYLDSDGMTSMYTLRGFPARPLPNWPKRGVAPASLSADHSGNILAAVNPNGTIQLYSANTTLLQLGNPALLRLPEHASHIAASIVANNKELGGLIRIVQLFTFENAVYAQRWMVTFPRTNASREGPPILLFQQQTGAFSADVVAQKYGTVLTIVVLSDDGSNCDNLRLTIIDWGNNTDPIIHSRIVGVGCAPSLSLRLSKDGTSTVVAAFSDAFCPNNEPRNKQTRPASCNQTPKSLPGVLGYTLGSLEAWRSAEAFSACSDTLLHGAFSQGGAPSVTIHNTEESNSVACIHDAYKGNDLNACGAPSIGIDDNGVVLDGWSFNVPE